MPSYTQKQLEAITSPIDAAVCLQSSPGSGKTTVIAGRYAFLVSSGVNPNGILAVTFSKSMADELGERILKSTPTACVERICTIHAACYRILKAEHDRRNVAKTWQIRDAINESASSSRLLKDVAWGELRDIFNLIAANGHTGQRTDDTIAFLESIGLNSQWPSELASAYWNYRRVLQSASLITFPEMGLDVEARLNSDEAFKARWQASISHVICDEGQDTTKQAMNILTTLAAPEDRFFICGDSDQTLFRWLGASPEANLFEGFENRYPNGKIIFLDTNFRSTKEIVSRGESLIRYNYEPLGLYAARFKKNVTPKSDAIDGTAISYTSYDGPEDEAQGIATMIEDLISNGRSPSEFFVAARTRAQLGYLEGPLAKRKIPFVNAAGGSFFTGRHIRVLLDYIRLAYNDDKEAFSSVYDIASTSMKQPWNLSTGTKRRKGDYSPNRWLGKAFLAEWEKYSNFKPLDAALRVTLDHNSGWKWRPGVSDLRVMVSRIQQYLQKSLIQALQYVALNYIEYVKAEEGHTESDPAENGIEDDFAALYEVAAQFKTPKELFEYIDECISVSEEDSWSGKVVLSTVHRLKGLERNVVFVIGCSEGRLPHSSALGIPMGTRSIPIERSNSLTDERDILFVAVTRAREEVHLSSISHWRDKFCQPSRFIEEMGLVVTKEYQNNE